MPRRVPPIVGPPQNRTYARVADAGHANPPVGLVRRYDDEAPDACKSTTVERAEESLVTTDIFRADIKYAVAHEGELSVDDVLDRYTRIGLVDSDWEAAFDELSELFPYAIMTGPKGTGSTVRSTIDEAAG